MVTKEAAVIEAAKLLNQVKERMNTLSKMEQEYLKELKELSKYSHLRNNTNQYNIQQIRGRIKERQPVVQKELEKINLNKKQAKQLIKRCHEYIEKHSPKS